MALQQKKSTREIQQLQSLMQQQQHQQHDATIVSANKQSDLQRHVDQLVEQS
jgi:hypothetical protein